MISNFAVWYAKVGPWTALLSAALLLMALAGFVQIMFVRQAANEMTQFMGFETPGASSYIWVSIGTIVVRIALLLICFGLLVSQFERNSVLFTLGGLWFIYPVLPVLSELVRNALTEFGMGAGLVPYLSPIDLSLNLVITAYLLFSRRVAEVYNIDTRTRIPATLRKLWAQARGRPTPETIEASRLHDTFK